MNRNETVRTLPTVYILRYIHQISRLFCRYYNFYFISLAHLLLFTKSKTVNLDRFDTSFVSRPFFQNCRITRFYGPDSHLFHRHFENFLLFIANFPPSFSLISITNPLQVKDISMFLHRGANFAKTFCAMFEFNRCQSSKIADSSFLTKLFPSVQSGIANCHRQNKPVISALFLPAEATGFAHFSQNSDLTAVLLSDSGWLSSSFPALFKALTLLPILRISAWVCLDFPFSFLVCLPFSSFLLPSSLSFHQKRRPACCADQHRAERLSVLSVSGQPHALRVYTDLGKVPVEPSRFSAVSDRIISFVFC